jgi:hypothetical protein
MIFIFQVRYKIKKKHFSTTRGNTQLKTRSLSKVKNTDPTDMININLHIKRNNVSEN